MSIANTVNNQKLNTDSNTVFNNNGLGSLFVTTAAATTILTVSSPNFIVFTGTMNQTCQMPDVATLPQLYWNYNIINKSSGNVTVTSSGTNTIQVLAGSSRLFIANNALTGGTASSWDKFYIPNLPAAFPLGADLGGTGVANNVANTQTFTGNYPLAWILTGSTSLTLPTSGTLATTSNLTPSNTQANITYTGLAINSPGISLSYISLMVNGEYLTNLINANIEVYSIVGPTTIDFGNVGALDSSFNTTAFNAQWSATTSITFSNLVYSKLTFTINAPLLTTLSLPVFRYSLSGLSLTLNSLATLDLSAMLITNTIILNSTSLTTVSLASLVFNAGNTSGTVNSVTTLTLTSLQSTAGWTLNTNALTTLSFPALVTMSAAFTPVATSLTTLSAPVLTSMTGSFSPTLASLTTLTLTNLVSITGAFGLVAANLTTLSLPALTTLSGGFAVTCAACTTLTLTLLATVTGAVNCSFAALTTMSLPAILNMTSTFTITAANMTTFSMNSGLLSVGGNWTMTGMALNQASVDGILVRLAALDGTAGTTAYSSKTINLSGGTSATPSATGLAAKVTLVARSCTVTTN